MIGAVLAVLLAPDPASAEALAAKGLEMAQQQRHAEAEAYWTKALAIQPGLFSASFNLGFMHYSRGNVDAAIPHLQRAARSQPKDFNSRYVLGACLVKAGRTDDALRAWREALALQPGHVKLMQAMAVEYGRGRYFREAAAIAERALNIASGDAAMYLIAIKAHQDAADHPAALRIAQQAIARFPDSPRVIFEYGLALHRAGRDDEASRYLTQAIESGGAHEEPFFFLAEIHMQGRRFEQAIPLLRKALELRPDYMAAWTALARSLMSLSRDAEARAELEKAIAIDRSHPQPRLLLSQVLLRLGDEAGAAREKEISLKLRRENPRALEAPQGRPFPAQ